MADEIRAEFKNFQLGKDYNVEDIITNQLRTSLPDELTLEELESWDTGACTGYDGCCKACPGAEDIAVVDRLSKLRLSTLHKVDDNIKNSLDSAITEEQKGRLQNADFVMLTDATDNITNGIEALSTHEDENGGGYNDVSNKEDEGKQASEGDGQEEENDY